MTLHIHRVDTRIASVMPHGELRWCFYCRKVVPFTRTVHVPTDPMSYYGPHDSIKCERGHMDGDCFPGSVREWSE